MKAFKLWLIRSIPLLVGIGLVAFGSISEIYYYMARFTAEGDHVAWAITRGVILNLLLLFSSTKTKKWYYNILSAVLVTFSIFCTSAGQAAIYAERYNARKSAVVNEERFTTDQDTRKADLESELSETKKAKRGKEIERDGILADKRTVWAVDGYDKDGEPVYQKKESPIFQTINSEIREYTDRISVIESELNDIGTVSVSVLEKESDPYFILSAITRIPPEIIQYVFQALYSLFTAIMAPIGINILIPLVSQIANSDIKLVRKRRKPIEIDNTTESMYNATMENESEPIAPIMSHISNRDNTIPIL